MSSTLPLDELYAPVRAELEESSAIVRGVLGDAFQLVSTPFCPSGELRAKLLRPALCLLGGGVARVEPLARLAPVAASVELIHVAALAHDDVVDDADTRRGERSLNAQWDNHAAVLGGDYLVARAIALMQAHGGGALVLHAAESIRGMAEAELLNFGVSEGEVDAEWCIDVARRKTASLFEVACSAGTFLGDTVSREPLLRYGEALGIAFQLVDDLLDLSQEEEVLGKPACNDLTPGRVTLPMLFLREGLDEAGRVRFEKIRAGEMDGADRHWLSHVLQETQARQRTLDIARQHIDVARAALAELPASVYRDSLWGLTEFVLSRDS